MKIDGFEWDSGNWRKCQKHGVSIKSIETLFEGQIHVFPDPAHSRLEKRFIAIGKSGNARLILVVFTLRDHSGQNFIRPISARYMHKKEIEHYEKEIAKTEKR